MTFEQKMAALNSIGECSIKMRAPGDWYVSQSRVEVKDRGCLVGSYGNGPSPVGAICDHWKVLVEDIEPTEKYLVLNATEPSRRRAVRWNGFMWADVAEPAK